MRSRGSYPLNLMGECMAKHVLSGMAMAVQTSTGNATGLKQERNDDKSHRHQDHAA